MREKFSVFVNLRSPIRQFMCFEYLFYLCFSQIPKMRFSCIKRSFLHLSFCKKKKIIIFAKIFLFYANKPYYNYANKPYCNRLGKAAL